MRGVFTTLLLGLAMLWLASCGATSGVYSQRGDTSGTPTPSPAGTHTPTVVADTQLLDFGGMWGSYYDFANSINNYHVNPITSAPSCPPGYSQTQVLGTNGLDYGLLFCSKPHVAGTEPAYDFGGMYGYTVNSGAYLNPYTNAAACPAGYSAAKAFGSPNGNNTAVLDYDLFFCWKVHTAGVKEIAHFGGMYGFGSANSTMVYYLNVPTTNGSSCPAGYSSHQTLGTAGVDWATHFCSL